MGHFFLKIPRSLYLFPIETTLFLAKGRPKVNIDGDFQSLNRLRYGGHVSNLGNRKTYNGVGMVNLSEV